jgi:hypothetical protein
MKLVFKVVVILLVVYAAIVVAFETWLGYSQPSGQSTLVITTTDDEGNPHDRVLSRMQQNGAMYVSANHWPRAWYRAALKHPHVQVTVDGVKGDYLVVPVTEDEHDRLEAEFGHPLLFRILTGFPPRYFVRLDPEPPASGDQR